MSGRTNVIFILTDDQGPWALGCTGNSEIRTPNLDRLAAEGMRFENFFCTSPVCSPARASIVSGRIPSQHGVHDWISGRNMPPDPAQYTKEFTCYTDVLAEEGYTCGLSGKWHLGNSLTPQHGFTHWFCMPGGGSKYQDAEMIREGKPQVFPGYLTDRIFDDALGFLDAHAKDEKPFYLSIHTNAPHSPWTGHPADLVAMYDNCPFKSCPQEAQHPWATPALLAHVGNHESLKNYFAAVTGVDVNIGRLRAKLQQLGLLDNTLIVFMSDNGFNCGHHGFWGKGNGTYPLNMYDNSVKVPAIFWQPGRIPAGKVSKAMVSQYDVLPTLLDYVGAPPVKDPTLPGVSIVPVLEGKTDQARPEVVVYDEYGPVRMIRTEEWKYVHRYPYGPHELYDLKNDPRERKNLVEDKSQALLVAKMRKRLAKWFARYVDPRLDGAKLPVYGRGQEEKITDDMPGESAFLKPEWVVTRYPEWNLRRFEI